jgi:hypothetical protein
MLIFQFCPANKISRDGFWLRDQRGIESSSFSPFVLVLDYDDEDDEDGINKNAFNSAKRGMKAFDEFRPALAGRTGLILLFAEKLVKSVDGL